MNYQYLDTILLIIAIGIAFVIYISTAMKQYIKQKNCEHKNTFIYTESVAATCEKITTTCMDCGKTTTKIEC